MSSSAGRAGASAYAALVEWENFGRLAGLAPGLADRIAVAEASAGALARYRAALDRLIAADREPAAMMAAGVRFVDAARARVAPSTWWEALVVAVVWVPLVDVLAGSAEVGEGLAGGLAADGLAAGLATDRSAGGSAPSGDGGSAVTPIGLIDPIDPTDPIDPDRDGWAVWRVREAIEADPVLGARLVLWGRRLGGEAIALAADFTGPEISPEWPRDAGPADAKPGDASRRDTGPGKSISGTGRNAPGKAGSGKAGSVPSGTIVAVQGGRAADFAALADQVAKAHTAALVPLFGQQEQRPATR